MSDDLKPLTDLNEVSKSEIPSETKKEEQKSPEQKLQEYLAKYSFIEFTKGKFILSHAEFKDVILSPKILKIGDITQRGVILASLNGGATNIDPETLALNECLASIQVGFENLPKTFNILRVEDMALIEALYLAVRGYNQFFRSTPVSFNI